MNQTKIKTSLLLACGLAFAALPCAFAGHTAKHSEADMFKKMDTNGDGQVSRAEHAASGKLMFADTDTNHNGVVTLTEMSVACDKMKAEMTDKPEMPGRAGQTQPMDKDAMDDMSAAEMIKMHDTNKDGQLSSAEQAKGCDEMFTQMDMNGDGQLSQDECTAGHQMMKKSKDLAATSKQ